MEIKWEELVEKHEIPETMAKRLAMLGNEALIEEAVAAYGEGVYQDTGGGRWENPGVEKKEE